MTNLEPGDIVMCTVDRIAGTTVYVKIDGNGEGSIILSEIAPGRIRNLRDYVVPKKVIICKVLRISNNQIELSLRRVTPKEQKEIKEKHKLEKSCTSVIRGILKEKADGLINEITKKETVFDFCERLKENANELEKYISKEEAKKIQDILKDQKQKVTEVKKEFLITTSKSDGLKRIKETLEKHKGFEIKYLSGGKYSIKKEGTDPKKTEHLIKELLEKIEKDSKSLGIEFSISER